MIKFNLLIIIIALKQQKIACIGKPNSDKRKEFEKKMRTNENQKTINAYNNVLKILNIKNKQFEQNVFNYFLEDQNIRAKEGKSFDINKCKEVVEKSSNLKIKQKFTNIVDIIEKATQPVQDKKPELKIKSYISTAKDMYPKNSTFTMKSIAARGMGKAIFLIAVLRSLINRGIGNHEDIYIFCPTFDEQDQRRSFSFMKRNFNHLNKDYSKGKLLVFGDMQLDTKGNKLIETLFLRGRHNKTGIIQCEQFTQSTAHIEKVNTLFLY